MTVVDCAEASELRTIVMGRFWMRTIRAFLEEETGATAIEYGLIAALIAVVIIAALTSLGRQVSGSFSRISSATAAAS
jgi:pilus assembly protein Flp/PilA